MNKKVFTLFKGEDGWFEKNDEKGTRKEFHFCVKRPDRKTEHEAQIIYNREYRELVRSGVLLKIEIDKILRERGLWDDQKEKEVQSIQKEISTARAKLSKGGKKSEAYKLAVQIIKLTNKLNEVNVEQNALNSQTAEGQADNARFNYYIFSCTYYNDGDNEGKKYFSNYDEVLHGEDTMINHAGLHLMELVFRTTEFRQSLPEYKFLKKFEFCDEDLRLRSFDKKGFVDLDNKLIDKDGFYVNQQGERVDLFGNVVKDSIDTAVFED